MSTTQLFLMALGHRHQLYEVSFGQLGAVVAVEISTFFISQNDVTVSTVHVHGVGTLLTKTDVHVLTVSF